MTPVLAFGFSTPLLLWGAALGAIPIVIHLLHRRKHREAPWAAMRFLIAAIQKNTRRLRLEQLLLLIVRALILVLLALALAQPYAESFGRYFQAEAPTQRVLIVDGTFSMGFRDGDTTRYERAKQIAQEIVKASRQGDAFNLLRICGTSPRAIVSQPAFQRQQMVDEVAQLALTDEAGDLSATLQEAIDALGRAPGIRRKEVYLLSDFQTATWGGASDEQRGAIQSRLKKLAEQADLVFFDAGRVDSPNTAIVDFSAEEPFVAVGRAASLQATLRSFGGPGSKQTAELYVDGRLAETQPVDLSAGGQARADFQVTIGSPGEHAVEVRLADDSLPLDNRRWLSLPSRDELRILLVNGRPAGRQAAGATWYLEKALAPSTERERWQGFTRPTVISEGDLAAADLSRYDVVVLSNVAMFTQREADILRNHVAAGGGLIIGLGDLVRPESYNQMLFGDDGVMPLRLDERKGNARSPEHAYEFDTADLSHPIVRPFQGNPGTGLEATLTIEYVAARLQPDSPFRTALRFTDGNAAIVAGESGRGRVVLFTTSLDVSWSSWAVQLSFPPIIHEAVRYAAAGRWSDRQRLVGEPITRTLPTSSAPLQASVRMPDGREKPMQSHEELASTALTFDGTDRAGTYEMVVGAPQSRSELFAVNIDPRESDPARLDLEQLRSELLPGVEFDYRTEWEGLSESPGDETTTARGGLSRWLLVAALALLGVEQLLAWRFAVGFAALIAIVAAVMARQAWTISPSGAAALGLAIAVVLALLSMRRMRVAQR